MRLYEAPGGRQTQTGTARFGREEWRKELFPDFRSDSWAVIGNRDLALAVIGCDEDSNQPTALHRLRRVDEQVLNHNLQQLRVRGQYRGFSRNVDSQILQRRVLTDEMRDRLQQQNHVDRRHSRLWRSGEEEQILHQVVERINARNDFPDDLYVLASGRKRLPIT